MKNLLSARIKEATAANHQLLEKEMMPFLKGMRNEADYGALLAKFYGFISPLEKLSHPFIGEEILPDLTDRRSADFLVHDLQVLNIAVEKLPVAQELPVIDSPYKAFGAMYVLEGSTLGGQIIAKMIENQTGINSGLCYFKSYGEQTRQMWVNFLEALNSAIPEIKNQETIDAANATFAGFKAWLHQPNPVLLNR